VRGPHVILTNHSNIYTQAAGVKSGDQGGKRADAAGSSCPVCFAGRHYDSRQPGSRYAGAGLPTLNLFRHPFLLHYYLHGSFHFISFLLPARNAVRAALMVCLDAAVMSVCRL
jgi:hypothetical protein